MNKIPAIIYNIISVSILVIIVWFCLSSCASTVYVPAKLQYPNIVPCPEMREATSDTWAQDILQRNENYEMCKIQTDILIKFINDLNKE